MMIVYVTGQWVSDIEMHQKNMEDLTKQTLEPCSSNSEIQVSLSEAKEFVFLTSSHVRLMVLVPRSKSGKTSFLKEPTK